MLIVDMEMPKGCYFCPFSETYPTHWFCRAFDDTTPIDGCAPFDNRRSWCPIKGELVRCGECKHWDKKGMTRFGVCRLWHDGYLKADFYCGDGERKDGAE